MRLQDVSPLGPNSPEIPEQINSKRDVHFSQEIAKIHANILSPEQHISNKPSGLTSITTGTDQLDHEVVIISALETEVVGPNFNNKTEGTSNDRHRTRLGCVHC